MGQLHIQMGLSQNKTSIPQNTKNFRILIMTQWGICDDFDEKRETCRGLDMLAQIERRKKDREMGVRNPRKERSELFKSKGKSERRMQGVTIYGDWSSVYNVAFM